VNVDRRNSAFGGGDDDLIEPTHHIARRIEAGDGGLLMPFTTKAPRSSH